MATSVCRFPSTPASARDALFRLLFVVAALLIPGLLSAPPLAAQAAKPPATKADSAKAKTTTTKAPAKPTTATKPSTTTTKPSTTTTKPSTTTTSKPSTSTSPTKASTDAKAADAKASETKPAAGRTSAPAGTGARTASGSASRSAAGGDRRDLVDAYNKVGVYAGGASAGLGFGTGPSAGLVWRLKSASLPVVFRADVSGSRFSQQPQTAGGGIAGEATLLHVGGSLGFEWVPGANRSVRPYLTVSGGIYRFQGDGPAGTNGDIVNGVFATTNDVALLAGAGLRLGQRVFLEARMVTVGDFQTIPVVIGVHF